MAMEWCPQAALQAYLHTLHLCKVEDNEDYSTSSCIIEPKCMEFVSALAAGKRARLIVQITSEGGITPLTLSLAVAAKQTGGRLVVFITTTQPLSHHHHHKTPFQENGLDGVVEFVYGIDDPCVVVKQLKDIDFAVVDCKVEGHLKLLKVMNLNPNGSMVVVNNLNHHYSKRGGGGLFHDQVFKGKKGHEYVTLPIGEGMELTRFRPNGKYQSKRYKRFHVTFEN